MTVFSVVQSWLVLCRPLQRYFVANVVSFATFRALPDMDQTRVAEVRFKSSLYRDMFRNGSDVVSGLPGPNASPHLAHQIAPGDSNVGSAPTWRLKL